MNIGDEQSLTLAIDKYRSDARPGLLLLNRSKKDDELSPLKQGRSEPQETKPNEASDRDLLDAALDRKGPSFQLPEKNFLTAKLLTLEFPSSLDLKSQSCCCK